MTLKELLAMPKWGKYQQAVFALSFGIDNHPADSLDVARTAPYLVTLGTYTHKQ